MIRSYKDRQILAMYIFDNNINNVYINKTLSNSNDIKCLFSRIEARKEIVTAFYKVFDNIYIATV